MTQVSSVSYQPDPGSGGTAEAVNLTQVGGTAIAAGPSLKAASLPVVFPTDLDYRPVYGSITARDIASSTATGQNGASIITGTPTSLSAQSWAINGMATVGVLVSGTWTGTLEFDSSYDGGTTWFPTTVQVRGVNFWQTSVTGNGDFVANVASVTNFRARSTAAITGTIVVQAAFSAGSGPVQVLSPNSAGLTASLTPASGPINAMVMAGRYQSSPDTFTDGQTGPIKLSAKGIALTTAADANGNIIDVTLPVQTYQSNSFANITSGTTTNVKSGSGTLSKITINTLIAAATITIYDNTAASGTKIGTITLQSTITGSDPVTLTYDISFATGLTIVTSGSTDLTVSYR